MTGRTALALVALIVAVPLSLFACGDDGPAPADATSETSLCERDDTDTPERAIDLPVGGLNGSLCPIGDVDWYRFAMPNSDRLLRVRLAMDGDLSPVEPSYIVWSTDAGLPKDVIAATPPVAIGFPLDEVHCIAPGPLLIAIRDDNDDSEDFRRSYRLDLTSSPDPDPTEPNDDAATAPALVSGQPVNGAIACTGDTDWYTFESQTNRIARLVFTMPVAKLSPLIRLQHADGDLVATRVNPSAAVRPTELILEAVLPKAGRYFAIVSDDDSKNADSEVSYTMTLTLLDDSDSNEPNGHPDTATALAASPVTCGLDWSGWVEATGTVGAIGDNDWFSLPVTCATQGLIEAEVVMNTDALSATERQVLAQNVQIALTFTRREPSSPCSGDLACQALTKSCDSEWDCSGLGNTCLPDGLCAGSGVCLPSGSCGADVVQRRFEPGDTAATTPHRAAFTAPLFGDSVVFLRVADFQSNGSARDVTYRLRVRIRTEPDANEPNNVYAPTLLADFPATIQTAASRPISVHDCTTDGISEPDCCGPDTWIEGYLSYENDLDFFHYTHPCPDEDCNLRIHYQLDAGPVDFVVNVYRGDDLWFGGVIGPRTESPTQSAMSGTYGGTSQCFYAYQGHTASESAPYSYHLGVRDLASVRDSSASQRYRLCVERVSRACDAPCKLYPDGCGQP